MLIQIVHQYGKNGVTVAFQNGLRKKIQTLQHCQTSSQHRLHPQVLQTLRLVYLLAQLHQRQDLCLLQLLLPPRSREMAEKENLAQRGRNANINNHQGELHKAQLNLTDEAQHRRETRGPVRAAPKKLHMLLPQLRATRSGWRLKWFHL